MAATPEPLTDLSVSPLAGTAAEAPRDLWPRIVRAVRLALAKAPALVGLSAVFSTPLAVFAATGHAGAGALATALVLGVFLAAAVVYVATGLALLRARDRVTP